MHFRGCGGPPPFSPYSAKGSRSAATAAAWVSLPGCRSGRSVVGRQSASRGVVVSAVVVVSALSSAVSAVY